MGGICAVSGHNAETIAGQMCQCLKHRGPDSEAVYAPVEGVALGHRALFVKDSDRVHQPLSNEDETIWVTFDGAIYNFAELKADFEKNHDFRSISSAELVVHAYEEEGLACVSRFNGDFAFCLWDSRKELLFSARDKLGVRPLYYHESDGSPFFLVASEIKALLGSNLVPRKSNKRLVSEYLLVGPCAHTGATFFEGISELLPGHYFVQDKHGVVVRRYWSPVQNIEKTGMELGTRDYASEFLELFRDSVRIRLPKDSLIGTFLSGGLDSASVACVIDSVLKEEAFKNNETRQELFSAAYPNTEADEKAYAAEVARALNSSINYLYPAVSGHWDDIENFVYHMDEPVPVFSYYVYWCLSQAAGSKLHLTFSGQGPDEVLGGHVEERVAYFRELWTRKKVARLFAELIGSSVQYKISKVLGTDIKGVLSQSGTEKSRLTRLLDPEVEANYLRQKTREESLSLEESLFEEVTRTLLLDHLQFGDRASSAFSVRTVYPFLDHRLVEFAFTLPADQKMRNGWTKFVLRNAMKGILPEAIRKRRVKLGTPVPLEEWLISLEKEIRAVFGSKKFGQRGYFNQRAVMNLYDDYVKGKMNRSNKTLYGNVLWRILNLELWSEAFFD